MITIELLHHIAIRILGLSVLAFVVSMTVSGQNNNTVQACYQNSISSLRRVNSPSDCMNSETPITRTLI